MGEAEYLHGSGVWWQGVEAGQIYLSRSLPCLGTLSARAGSLDSSALGGPSGLSKPAGLGLQRGDWRVPVRLIHWKMLIQTLLPSSTVPSFLGVGGGGGWTRAAHSAQDAQTGKLPPAFLPWDNPDLLCFLIAADPMFTPGLGSDLLLSLDCVARVSRQPRPPFPEQLGFSFPVPFFTSFMDVLNCRDLGEPTTRSHRFQTSSSEQGPSSVGLETLGETLFEGIWDCPRDAGPWRVLWVCWGPLSSAVYGDRLDLEAEGRFLARERMSLAPVLGSSLWG